VHDMEWVGNEIMRYVLHELREGNGNGGATPAELPKK